MSEKANAVENNNVMKREEHTFLKPIRISKRHHRKSEESKYNLMKVYPVSNKSSRERLQKMIIESKEKISVFIQWDEI